MQFLITTRFFFIVLNLLAYSHSNQGGKNFFLGRYPIPDDTSDPINIDTSKVKQVHLCPLILSINGRIPINLENTGTLVQATPLRYNPTHYITGGPLGKFRYRFWSDRIYWTDNPDELEGTAIDYKGAPVRYRGFFINNKYNETEALIRRDGIVAVFFFTPLCEDDEPNPDFFPLYNAIRKIQMPGSRVNTTLSVLLQANDGLTRLSKYYTYPGSYADQKGNRYFCATVIVFPIDKKKCVSKKQLAQSFGLLKNYTMQTYTYQHWRYNATMPIVEAQGVCQKG